VKNKAFTLAEVLITLGIIGVVAALTIPALTASYRKKVVETRLAKFYSTMAQAVKLSEIDNGEVTTWEPIPGTGKTEQNLQDWYDKYFKSYLKDVKTEEVGRTTLTFPVIAINFPDGSALRLQYAGIHFFVDAKNVNKVEDRTYKNTMGGKEFFTFGFWPDNEDPLWKYHYGKGFEPYAYGWDGTETHLRTESNVGCKETVANERAYCTKLIQLNGWKIPDDYPLSF
jgi:prepilin-type N-terminal cleavage/methylation domain-containing protein